MDCSSMVTPACPSLVLSLRVARRLLCKQSHHTGDVSLPMPYDFKPVPRLQPRCHNLAAKAMLLPWLLSRDSSLGARL